MAVALHVRAWVEMMANYGAEQVKAVALHVRAWVEIGIAFTVTSDRPVALHVRAWVEIITEMVSAGAEMVALHVRAWVEILPLRAETCRTSSRPPCEGVGRNMAFKLSSSACTSSPSM